VHVLQLDANESSKRLQDGMPVVLPLTHPIRLQTVHKNGTYPEIAQPDLRIVEDCDGRQPCTAR